MNKKIISTTLIFLLILGNIIPLRSFAQEATPTTEPSSEQIREEEKARREVEKQAAIAEREAQSETERAIRRGDITPTPTAVPTEVPTPVVEETQVSDTTGSDSETTADQQADVSNENSATVENNNSTLSNTGDNVVSSDSAPTPTITTIPVSTSDPLPVCENEANTSADVAGEENTLLYDSSEVAPVESETVAETNSNESQLQDNDSVEVENSNCASLTNEQDVNSNTGGNDVSDNGSVKAATGGASADSTMTNKGNTNTTSSTADEEVQGQSSSTQELDSLGADNNNQIYVTNDVNVESTSGANSVNDNDGRALLTTGDVDMMVTLMNILNMNITGEDFTHLIVNIFGDLSGDVDLNTIAGKLGMTEDEFEILLENEEHMAEKQEQLLEKQEKEAKIKNNNDAQVVNNVNVTGVSGLNTLSGNEDKTALMTGRIKILVALINFINTNYSGSDWYFAMINVFGSLNGDLILPDPNYFLSTEGNVAIDSQVGDLTQVREQNTTVTNNNNVEIENNISVTGDSGTNLAYANENFVKQNTGSVTTESNLTNWLNINILGNNWVLLVINVFGTWYGQILGFPGQDPINSPQSGTLVLSAGGTNNTGPNITSGSDTTSKSSENTDVQNNNTAKIENNVNIKGISGQNTTNNNEDPVFVTTGWVDITTDLLNIVNMNVTGKKWMLVMVNVFGDFFGDITFPGVKKEAAPEFKAEGELVQELVAVGSVDSNEQIIVTPTVSKIQTIAYVNQTSTEPEEKITEIESFAANTKDSNNESNDNATASETKILGISVDNSNTTSQILILVALISYLIALRLIAFRKTYN
ncbi:hypothetical protein HYT02_04780 [Candidatus Gottesmanbacteria bacterium]|nr:hypothetical protein [Candidatus Gottesmanbacteria bacterium]